MRGKEMKTAEGVTCVYSVAQEGRAKTGVAIYVAEEKVFYIKEWKRSNERMVLVRLKIRKRGVDLFAPVCVV